MKKLMGLLSVMAIFATVIIVPNIKTVFAADGETGKATPEHGIPVINVNIDESKGTIKAMNSSEDHSVMCYGTLDIDVPDGYISEYTGAECEDITGLEMEYIRGRGNSTWQQSDKKPYKIKLEKSNSLLGMGKTKHWALIANALENSFVRNRMTYWMGSEMGVEFTPKCLPVELYMNGEYYGLYYLSETIRIEESGVNIDELTESDNDEPDITGGYLFANVEPETADENGGFITEKGMGFVFDNPDFSEYENENQRKYIEDYITKTEEAIYGEGFKDKDGISYKEYMDVQSAADYFWFQNVSMNQDAYLTDSTYLNKRRNDKLYWGPLWDFDSPCWGNLDVIFGGGTYEGMSSSCAWFDRLRQDPEFVSVLEDRWKVMDAVLADLTKKGGQLDKYYAELKPAADVNAAKWGYYMDEVKSYEEAIEGLRTWIDNRREWINNNLDQLALEEMSEDTGEEVIEDDQTEEEQKEEQTEKEQTDNKKASTNNIGKKSYSNEWIDGQWIDASGQKNYPYKGSWKENSTGWWYEDTSGWYPVSQWQKIDSKWYYFTGDGYMDYSEYRDGCWLGSDGSWNTQYGGGRWMQDENGWWYDDNGWYPANQYLWIDGVKYWFDASGYMR